MVKRSKATRGKRRGARQDNFNALMGALVPHKERCPPFPPQIVRNPAITKWVRGYFKVESGTDTSITTGAIALDDAGDYLGAGTTTVRYRTLRIMRVRIWGPFLAIGDTTTPTQSMFVDVYNYGPGAGDTVLSLEDSVAAGETARRPNVAFHWGGGATYTYDTGSTTTICKVLGASAPGVYTADLLVVFQ